MSYSKAFIKGVCLTPQNHLSTSVLLLEEMFNKGDSFRQLHEYGLNDEELNHLADAMIVMHKKYFIGVGKKGKDNSELLAVIKPSFFGRLFRTAYRTIGDFKLHAIFRTAQVGSIHFGKELLYDVSPNKFQQAKNEEDSFEYFRGYYSPHATADVLDELVEKYPVKQMVEQLSKTINSADYKKIAKEYRDTFISKDLVERSKLVKQLSGTIKTASNAAKNLILEYQ